MILSAGFGSRLRPLTNHMPKALIPFGNDTMLDHQINYLKSNGITKIIINLHYLGHMIKKHVQHRHDTDITITFSDEKEILGTGGGIQQASHLFQCTPIVIINCDIIIDYPLQSLIHAHAKNNAIATMVLRPLAMEDPYTPVNRAPNGHITQFHSGQYHYTGLQVLSPEFINILPKAGHASCLINDGYAKAVSHNLPIASVIHDNHWHDIGTHDQYNKALKNFKFK